MSKPESGDPRELYAWFERRSDRELLLLTGLLGATMCVASTVPEACLLGAVPVVSLTALSARHRWRANQAQIELESADISPQNIDKT